MMKLVERPRVGASRSSVLGLGQRLTLARTAACVLVALLLTLVPAPAQVWAAAAGSLDLSFDADGKVTTAVGGTNDRAASIAIQGDGKILAAGHSFDAVTGDDFALVRYNSDGSIDPTFGVGGEVVTAFGPSTDQAYSVAIQADGKIVAGGVSYVGGTTAEAADMALARYNADGSLDTTFDTDGMLTTAFDSSTEWINSVAIQADGKIVVGGLSRFDFGSFYNFALARYNTDGSLDTSFDTDGRVVTDIASANDRASEIVIQSDGDIVAAGNARVGADDDFALARYNADGSLDLTFDVDGKVTTSIGPGHDDARTAVLQADGRIIAAGYSFSGSTNDFGVIRYNTDGSLDTSFDADGKVTTAFDCVSGVFCSSGTAGDDARSIALQTNGKIVVAGLAGNGTDNDFGVARYNVDGSLDDTFDSDGRVVTPFVSGADVADSIAIQTDGRIVAGGYSNNGTDDDFALARYATYALSVTLDGTGAGNVSSDPVGIDCGVSCSDIFNSGASVILTATPDPGSVFAGWAGDCSGMSTCTLGMDAPRAAVATFDVEPPPPPIQSRTLVVTKTGMGEGSVSSVPSGIDCGSDCVQSYLEGTTVTLTAAAGADSHFVGWSGDCTGTMACDLTMAAARAVTARFEPIFMLTNTKMGTGTGTVTGSGIDCGVDCSAQYVDGASVTLTAAPDEDSSFESWQGCDSVSELHCTVTMDADRTVTVSFDADPLVAVTCDGQVPTIEVAIPGQITYGTTGVDVIVGTEGDDTIYGLDHADVICGLGGNDQLYGGGGKGAGRWGDRIYGGAGSDRIAGDGGDDHLVGGPGNDRVFGDIGNDSIFGTAGRDRLYGNGGGDSLVGGSGMDSCNGGPGLRDVSRRCELSLNIP